MSKHTQILEQLIRRVQTGAWKPGEQLPGVRSLALEFACCPATMAQVMQDLARRGYVAGRARAGVFVAPADHWGTAHPVPRATLVGVLDCGGDMLASIGAELREHGYDMVVRAPSPDAETACRNARELQALGVVGIIWSPLSTADHETDNLRLAETLLATGLPVVAVDRYPQAIEVNCVVSDNAQAGYALTRHLLELGHRRIGLLRHCHGSTPEDRQRGYRRALAAAGLAPGPDLVLTVPHHLGRQELVERVRDWLLATRPTAAWSIAGDPLGLALLAGAQAAGLRVPEDLSVATFDEIVAPWPVTAMIQPFAAIGCRAARLLLAEIRQPSGEIHRLVLPSRLVAGASCRPWPPLSP